MADRQALVCAVVDRHDAAEGVLPGVAAYFRDMRMVGFSGVLFGFRP
jgi:hypothetical protein